MPVFPLDLLDHVRDLGEEDRVGLGAGQGQ